MPPTTAVPRDHRSTIPNILGGNTIIAIIISVIISVIAIGWFAYCCYTRHIGYGVSIDAGHPDVDAGDGYIAVYTPRYTREGYTRPRTERPPPRRKGPRRIVVHQVPRKDHRYRIVRGVLPPQQGAQGVVSGGSPQAHKQDNQNQSNVQQQQKQENQNQGKKKQKGKKNKQKKNNNQSGDWSAAQAEDHQEQEEGGQEQRVWDNNGQNDNNQQETQDGWQVPEQNQGNGWSNQQTDQISNSPRPSAAGGDGNGAIYNQLGWCSGTSNHPATAIKW